MSKPPSIWKLALLQSLLVLAVMAVMAVCTFAHLRLGKMTPAPLGQLVGVIITVGLTAAAVSGPVSYVLKHQRRMNDYPPFPIYVWDGTEAHVLLAVERCSAQRDTEADRAVIAEVIVLALELRKRQS